MGPRVRGDDSVNYSTALRCDRRAYSAGCNVGRGRFGAILGETRNDDVTAIGREAQRRGFADAATGTGYDCYTMIG